MCIHTTKQLLLAVLWGNERLIVLVVTTWGCRCCNVSVTLACPINPRTLYDRLYKVKIIF